MLIKDQKLFDECIKNNQDPYGKAAYDYAVEWADLMEARMAEGEALVDIADDCTHQADEDYGITGFMYGCAVSMLAACWEHGEDLRRWHNTKTQITNEGDKANDSGGVLNPAILQIGE